MHTAKPYANRPIKLNIIKAAAAFNLNNPLRLMPTYLSQYVNITNFKMAIIIYIKLESVSYKGYA